MADTKIVSLICGRICRVVLGMTDVGDVEDEGGESRPQHDQQEQGGKIGEKGKEPVRKVFRAKLICVAQVTTSARLPSRAAVAVPFLEQTRRTLAMAYLYS